MQKEKHALRSTSKNNSPPTLQYKDNNKDIHNGIGFIQPTPVEKQNQFVKDDEIQKEVKKLKKSSAFIAFIRINL